MRLTIKHTGFRRIKQDHGGFAMANTALIRIGKNRKYVTEVIGMLYEKLRFHKKITIDTEHFPGSFVAFHDKNYDGYFNYYVIRDTRFSICAKMLERLDLYGTDRFYVKFGDK